MKFFEIKKTGNMSDNHACCEFLAANRFSQRKFFRYEDMNGKKYRQQISEIILERPVRLGAKSIKPDITVILKNGVSIFLEIDITSNSKEKAERYKDRINMAIFNLTNMKNKDLDSSERKERFSNVFKKGVKLECKQKPFKLPLFQNKIFSSAFVDEPEGRIIIGSDKGEALYLYTEPRCGMGKNEFFWGDFSNKPYDFKKDFFEQI